MGWDALGLPATQHAIETGQHPAGTTANNIATFKLQLKMRSCGAISSVPGQVVNLVVG